MIVVVKKINNNTLKWTKESLASILDLEGIDNKIFRATVVIIIRETDELFINRRSLSIKDHQILMIIIGPERASFF